VAVETIYLLGEGGGIHKFDADKLDDRFLDRLARGDLKRVNADGSPYVESEKLTPKQLLQADARAIGLDDSGTVPEITARIDEKVAELLKRAAELDIDADKLSAVDLLAAVNAKLAE
jgi:hypothetical protein